MADAPMQVLGEQVTNLQQQIAQMQATAQQAPGTGDGLANTRDLERIVKVDKYAGGEDEFVDFSDIILSHAGALGGGLYDRLKEAATCVNPMNESDYTPAVRLMSRQVHHLLTCHTEQGAAKVVRSVSRLDGFEAWRLLHRRWGRLDQMSSLGLQQQIIKFNFGEDLKQLDERLGDFKLRYKECDESPLAEVPSDMTMRAVLIEGLPEPLKSHLTLNSNR